MDFVEVYARQWAKREKKDLDILSERMKSVGALMQIRIKKLNGSMNTRKTSTFKDPKVAKHRSHLYDKYLVPADKTSINVVFVL
jgi:hypothetical protein